MAPRPNAAATNALGAEVVRPAHLCWLDILGDPVRATTWPYSLIISGTGDTGLDGYTFQALDPTLVRVSEIKHQDGGSETVRVSLSGLILPDSDLFDVIGNPGNWRGRDAQFWTTVYSEANVQQGTVWKPYIGWMNDLRIRGSASEQVIEVSIETYLATLAPPSNRTMLDKSFDPDDRAPDASIATANGVSGTNPGVAGGSYSGGGGRPLFEAGINKVL